MRLSNRHPPFGHHHTPPSRSIIHCQFGRSVHEICLTGDCFACENGMVCARTCAGNSFHVFARVHTRTGAHATHSTTIMTVVIIIIMITITTDIVAYVHIMYGIGRVVCTACRAVATRDWRGEMTKKKRVPGARFTRFPSAYGSPVLSTPA